MRTVGVSILLMLPILPLEPSLAGQQQGKVKALGTLLA